MDQLAQVIEESLFPLEHIDWIFWLDPVGQEYQEFRMFYQAKFKLTRTLEELKKIIRNYPNDKIVLICSSRFLADLKEYLESEGTRNIYPKIAVFCGSAGRAEQILSMKLPIVEDVKWDPYSVHEIVEKIEKKIEAQKLKLKKICKKPKKVSPRESDRDENESEKASKVDQLRASNVQIYYIWVSDKERKYGMDEDFVARLRSKKREIVLNERNVEETNQILQRQCKGNQIFTSFVLFGSPHLAEEISCLSTKYEILRVFLVQHSSVESGQVPGQGSVLPVFTDVDDLVAAMQKFDIS